MRLTSTKGLGLNSSVRWRQIKRSTSRKLFKGVKQCLPSRCRDCYCSIGGLLVTTDIERVSHPPCGHNNDVANRPSQ